MPLACGCSSQVHAARTVDALVPGSLLVVWGRSDASSPSTGSCGSRTSRIRTAVGSVAILSEPTSRAARRIEVVHNAEANRYELHVATQLAGYSEYHDRTLRGVRTFIHTEVFDTFQGAGLGTRLAKAR